MKTYPHYPQRRSHDLAGLLEAACREVVDNPAIDGIAIWPFCDGRTYATCMATARPRTFNNKGIVDEYRRTKLACDRVQAVFTG